MKKIGILGSTGSVGSQTLEIIDEYKSEFELVFISGHSNIEKLNNQIDKYNPKYACISNDDILNQISDTIKCKKLYKGNRGLLDLCDIEVDLVVNAISGYKGLYLSVKLLENITIQENTFTSSTGRGIAFPHSTSIELDDLTCVLGISSGGIDFNSPDGHDCHLILLTLSPVNEPTEHRKFITRFRSMVQNSNLRTNLCESENPEEVFKIISKWEEDNNIQEDLI